MGRKKNSKSNNNKDDVKNDNSNNNKTLVKHTQKNLHIHQPVLQPRKECDHL